MNDTAFEFLGKKYVLSDLKYARILKTYWEHSHSERTLIEDQYGRLFHAMYEEDIRFDGGNDRVDYIWTLVENKADSDILQEEGRFTLSRPPYIAADETGWVAVNETPNSRKIYESSKPEI